MGRAGRGLRPGHAVDLGDSWDLNLQEGVARKGLSRREAGSLPPESSLAKCAEQGPRSGEAVGAGPIIRGTKGGNGSGLGHHDRDRSNLRAT